MLTESMEDYLEMVYRLVKANGYVRAVDLAESLKVQASSVTRMIQKLDEAGFIRYEKYRNIALTEMGERYGEFLVWRDETLKRFLVALNAQDGVDEQVEGMEHYITPKTMSLIRCLLEFFENAPKAQKQFHSLQEKRGYPDGVELDKIRAWDYRHSSVD